jgi:integrase/recombinase XerD
MPEKRPNLPKGCYWRGETIWARFKVGGVEYRKSLRTHNVSQAERRLKAVKQQTIDEVYFGAQEAVSWKAAVVSWSTLGPSALGIKPNTYERYLVSLGQLRPWLDEKDVQEVDSKLLKAVVHDRQRLGVSNATIRRDMTAVSSVLGHCVDKDWIEENAAKTLDRSRFKERREPIILPRQESVDMVFALGSRFIDMAEFALETGMREEEIASLEHDRVDRKRMAIVSEENKGNEVKHIVLTSKALAIIDRQPRYLRKPYVFWRGEGERFQNVGAQFYATVQRVARKAAQQGIEFKRYRFHDLRHLFAVRYLQQRRGTLYDLQLTLGHKSIKTTEGYLKHLTPDERRDAIHGVAQNSAQDQRFEEEKGGKNG